MIPRALVLFVLLFLPLIAAAESPVPAPLVFGPAPGTQTRPRIAADGDRFFAVWRDDREGDGEITYAARLGRDGTLLDSIGIRLLGVDLPTAVGCGAGRCLVVSHQLAFAMIDRDGRVVARGDLGEMYSPIAEVIYNGRDFVVFWSRGSVNVSTVDIDGRVVGPASVIVPYRDFSNIHFQSAALNGSRVVVMYTDDNMLKAAVTGSTGAVVTTGDVIGEHIVDFSDFGATVGTIASSGGVFAALWGNAQTGALMAQRFDADGTRAGDPLIVHGGHSNFDIAPDRGAFTIYLTENGQLTSIPLSREGVAGEAGVVMSVPPFAVALGGAAGDESGSLAAVSAQHPNGGNHGTEVYAAGEKTPPVMLSRAGAAQTNPKIAVGAATTLVVYEENRGAGLVEPETSIYATFTDRLTGATSTFAVAPSTLLQGWPEVAVVGDAYLVTWTEGNRLLGRIVRDGAPSGTLFEIDPIAYGPSKLGSDGRDFIAAWVHVPSSLGTARISANGGILARGELIHMNAPLGPSEPALACSREECLLAWRDTVVTSCPGACIVDEHVKAVRILPSLVPRDTTALILTANMALGNGTLAAAADGTYAVAWEHHSFSPQIVTFTVDSNGVPGPNFVRSGRRPALARQGDSWLLFRTTGSDEPQLAVVRFHSGASTGVVDFVHGVQSRRHASAAIDGTRVLVAYERTTHDEEAGGVPRIYLDSIEPRPRVRAVRR